MRKSPLIFIFLIGFLLTGCNKEQPFNLNEDELVNIGYHYWETIELHADFLLGLSSRLKKPITEELEDVEEIVSFIDGYKISISKRSLYDDMESIVYKPLLEHYNENTLENSKQINKQLNDMPNKLRQYLSSKEAINPTDISNLYDSLYNLAFLIYPSKQDDLGLYNILIYPERLKRIYTDEEINNITNNIEDLIEQINKSLNYESL